MGLVDAPIKGLPSYLSMLKRPGSAMPRWWIAADYKPLLTDADGLTWELRPGVKVLTEDSASSGGKLQPAGRNNAVAQKWADAMTKSFDDLATQESIFAELRNCMDMAVLAALIKTNRLDEKSGLDLSLLLDRERLVTDTYSVPREVDTRVSFVKRGGQWIISASGGVQYAPYEIVSQTQKSETLAKIREKTAATGDAWWQNK
jgi:hypothetical protein